MMQASISRGCRGGSPKGYLIAEKVPFLLLNVDIYNIYIQSKKSNRGPILTKGMLCLFFSFNVDFENIYTGLSLRDVTRIKKEDCGFSFNEITQGVISLQKRKGTKARPSRCRGCLNLL
jgi:hypothetical protein